MRTFLVVVVVGALGVLYLWQKRAETPGTPSQTATEVKASSSPSTSQAAAATPAREVSEHNWMKRSLDRARDVSQQARSQTKASQDP